MNTRRILFLVFRLFFFVFRVCYNDGEKLASIVLLDLGNSSVSGGKILGDAVILTLT
jgi:hypothetical protein